MHALCCAALEHRPVHACLPVTAHPMHWVQRPQAEPQWPVIVLPDVPEPTSCWDSLLGCDIRARPTPTIGQTGRGHVGWAAACCVLCVSLAWASVHCGGASASTAMQAGKRPIQCRAGTDAAVESGRRSSRHFLGILLASGLQPIQHAGYPPPPPLPPPL